MTQHEAKSAIKHLRRSLISLQSTEGLDASLHVGLQYIIDDVNVLLSGLETRKPAMPNCRPATPEELRQLCASSNVVVFRPAA